MKSPKTLLWYGLSALAGVVAYMIHLGPFHPLVILSLLIIGLVWGLDLRRHTAGIKRLLPLVLGLLCFGLRLLYWDGFDLSGRVIALWWLSVVAILFIWARDYSLVPKSLKVFNGWRLGKRLWFIFICMEILFILSSYIIVDRGVKWGGDEPHYLAVAQSVVKDFDLNVFNQYFRGEYREFAEVEKLPAHGAFGRGYKKMYSTHLPGVSVIVAPLLLLKVPLPLLYFFVRAYLGLFGALLAVLVYLFSLRLWADENLSLSITCALMLTAPVFFLSIHLFPEIQALLLVLAALYLLLFPGQRILLKTFAAGFCLGALVFWGLKYMIFTYLFMAGFALYFAWKRAWKRMLVLAIWPLVFSVLFFYYLYFAYGTFSPMAVYTGMMSESQAKAYYAGAGAIPLGNRVETLLGYFFDQRDGLLPYSPFYFFAFPGLILALRRFKIYWPYLAISAVGGIYILYHAYSTVRAGYCPQGRYLVPVMWMLALFWVIYLREGKNGAAKKLSSLLLVYSLLVTVYQVFSPFTLYQPATHDSLIRPALMFQQWGNPYFNPAHWLPSFAKVEGNFRYLPNLVWLVFLPVLFFWSFKRVKERPGAYGPWCMFILALALFVLPPRVGLYNPLLVQPPGGLPFTVYRESAYPGRRSDMKLDIRHTHEKTITVSTPRPVTDFVVELTNPGKNSLEVELYGFDTHLHAFDILPGQKERAALKTAALRRKNKFFYRFTLVLKEMGGNFPAAAVRLYPVLPGEKKQNR